MELPLFLIISFFKLFRVTFGKISVQPGEIFPTKLRDLALLPFHSGATIVESSALMANTRTKRTAMYCANTFSLHAGIRLENVLLQPVNNLWLSVT